MIPSKRASSRPDADKTAQRATLEIALEDLGETPEQVSIAIEMPLSYLRIYLEHGVPQSLPNRVRRRLASHLGVPDFVL